jgi:Rieske Fe-S protein
MINWPSSACPQGDPTYLIVKEDGTLENYGLNAVCTHLGCVVPWVSVSTVRMDVGCATNFIDFVLTPHGRKYVLLKGAC